MQSSKIIWIIVICGNCSSPAVGALVGSVTKIFKRSFGTGGKGHRFCFPIIIA